MTTALRAGGATRNRSAPPLGRRIALWSGALALAVGPAVYALFGRLTSTGATDILNHIKLLQISKETGKPLGYSVYYALLEFFAFGNLDPAHLRLVAVWLLTVAMVAKLVLTFAVIARLTGHLRWSLAATLFVFIAMPLNLTGRDRLYLGRFTGSIWHNSTTIVLLPVSILLFWAVVRYLDGRDTPRWLPLAAAALSALDAAVKPNFVLAFLPATALVLLVRMGRVRQDPGEVRRLASRGAVVAVPAVAVLAVQYYLAFASGGVSFTTGIEPFAVWRAYSHTVGLHVVGSFAWPVAATIALGRPGVESRPLVLAWATVAVALAEFAVFAEYAPGGALSRHGNWIWAAQVATYLLFVVCAALAVRHRRELAGWARTLLIGLAALHAAWGLVYLYRLAVFLDYG